MEKRAYTLHRPLYKIPNEKSYCRRHQHITSIKSCRYATVPRYYWCIDCMLLLFFIIVLARTEFATIFWFRHILVSPTRRLSTTTWLFSYCHVIPWSWPTILHLRRLQSRPFWSFPLLVGGSGAVVRTSGGAIYYMTYHHWDNQVSSYRCILVPGGGHGSPRHSDRRTTCTTLHYITDSPHRSCGRHWGRSITVGSRGRATWWPAPVSTAASYALTVGIGNHGRCCSTSFVSPSLTRRLSHCPCWAQRRHWPVRFCWCRPRYVLCHQYCFSFCAYVGSICSRSPHCAVTCAHAHQHRPPRAADPPPLPLILMCAGTTLLLASGRASAVLDARFGARETLARRNKRSCLRRVFCQFHK